MNSPPTFPSGLTQEPIPPMLTQKEDIQQWLKVMRIRRYKLIQEQTGQWVVDVPGNVDLTDKNLSFFPIQFNRIEGSFLCGKNSLKSLKGAPREVWHEFNVSHNLLISLEFTPLYIGGSFNCSHNQLTSLVGCPKRIEQTFDCDHNLLSNLKGGPEVVRNHYSVSHNPINSLLFFPKEVGHGFFLADTPLAPQMKEWSFEAAQKIHLQELQISKEKAKLEKIIATKIIPNVEQPTDAIKRTIKI